MADLTPNQVAILKQAAGEIAQPDYSDHRQMASDMAELVELGLIQRVTVDDQPTAYATLRGQMVLDALPKAKATPAQERDRKWRERWLPLTKE